jgi:hypothetical protein
MRRPTRPIRCSIALAAATTLALAACGSDGGGGGGSTEAFCEEIGSLADSDVETTEAQDLAALQAVAAAAPSDISDEMNQLVDAFEQVQSFDAETASEDDMTDFLALAGDIDAASTAVEEFASENCPDLPADFFSTE